MFNFRKLFVLLAAAVLLVWGCSDRGDYAGPTAVVEGGPSDMNHAFFEELILQLQTDNSLMQYTAYVPPGSYGLDNPVPVLVLLAPYGEDRFFYIHHGIIELMDDMIAAGEIEPMFLCMLPSDRVFGGYFYAGQNHGAGKYDEILGQKLIPHLEERFPTQVITGDASKRGIGGVGQGAYGAYRAALVSPGVYSSVSGLDGPLDFDGADGESGLVSMMNDVFETEQPHLTAENFLTSFDSSRANPISRTFCGGAMAFSPHDLALDSLISWQVRTGSDGRQWVVITIDSDLRGTPGHIIDNDSSLITNVVNADAYDLEFHLPFTYNDRPYAPIWSYWMANNLDSLLLGGGSLNGVDLWVGTSDEAKWAYHDMTESWISTLQGQGLEPTVVRYEGYPGTPASDHQYIYDVLRQMLKFHSDSFNK